MADQENKAPNTNSRSAVHRSEAQATLMPEVVEAAPMPSKAAPRPSAPTEVRIQNTTDRQRRFQAGDWPMIIFEPHQSKWIQIGYWQLWLNEQGSNSDLLGNFIETGRR